MKRFNTLYKKLQEHYGVSYNSMPPGGLQSADDIDTNITDLGDGAALQKLNAFVGSICERDYIDPRNALQVLQRKLSLIGLQFDIPKYWQPITAENSTVPQSFPLKMFGGRYGFVDMDGQVKEDDGITPKLGYGLNLDVHYKLNENGSTCVYAKISPSGNSNASGPVPVTENSVIDSDDMFSVMRNQKHYTSGQQAHKSGLSITRNPHSPGSKEHEYWKTGYEHSAIRSTHGTRKESNALPTNTNTK